MLVAKFAYFNCIIYKGLHSLIASLLVSSRQPLWKPTLGYTLLFTLLVDKNGHTGQLILDDFRNISDQKINPNLSTRISWVKTNVLNTCGEMQEPTPQCRSKARIDLFIVNFSKQVSTNGRYNSRTNYSRVKTACAAFQGLESRDSHKGLKLSGQSSDNTMNSVKKCSRRLLRETIFEFKETRDSEKWQSKSGNSLLRLNLKQHCIANQNHK